jgi:hypothetical protein
MLSTSLSDILVCARTSAMSGPRPVARQVRTQLPCRGSAVRSIALLGVIVLGAELAARGSEFRLKDIRCIIRQADAVVRHRCEIVCIHLNLMPQRPQ